jgi:hypothetical protein
MEPVARCSIQPVFTAIDIGIQLAWGCLIKGVVGEFLSSLIERGMYSVEFIVSDAHERLGNAARSTCSKTPCSSPQFDTAKRSATISAESSTRVFAAKRSAC